MNAYDYDVEGGEVTRRRTFADLTDTGGRPDGLTVDARGGVWVAVARAGRVHRYDPDGQLSAVYELPVPRVTSCTFGGTDLTLLFVTTGREGGSDDYRAGGLFCLSPGVAGRPAMLWRHERTGIDGMGDPE